MMRTVIVFVFLLGLFGRVSPAVAGVNAEDSGNNNVDVSMPYIERKLNSFDLAFDEKVFLAPYDSNSVAEQVNTAPMVALVPSDTKKSLPMEEAKGVETKLISVEKAPVDTPQVAPIHNQTTINVEAPATATVTNGADTIAYHKSQDSNVAASAGMVKVEAKAEEKSEEDSWDKIYVIPMVGRVHYQGRWSEHLVNVSNRPTFGLIIEKPITKALSVELEGAYGRYHISYSSYGHFFNQFGIGGNGKFYLLRGTFSPYIGAGIMGLYYHNMTGGPMSPRPYNHWLGSGQLVAGADVEVIKDVAIGLRGAYIRPLFNKPATVHNGYISAPGYEESAAINTAYWKVMGAVKIGF